MLRVLKGARILRKNFPVYLSQANFGGGHGHDHHEVYDWRDDPAVNKDLYVDPRDVGWNPAKYTFPYQGRDDWFFNVRSENYDASDLSVNLVPENRKSDILFNPMRVLNVPYWNETGETAHEADYESEDLDFQPEDFKTQARFSNHFRKRGPLWPWLFCGNLLVIYFWVDFILQKYPDEDHWRISRLPPLDYPDQDDTDDTDTFSDYNSKGGRLMVESGIVGEAWFDIVDGKKIPRRFAGVNPPMHDF